MTDFKTFDERFDNNYPVAGPEWGDLEARKDIFIDQNKGKYNPEPVVPLNIKGLTPLKGRIPSNRNWYKRISSFERNGFFNIHTPVFNTKLWYWTFFITIVWGNIQHVLQGYSDEHYRDNFSLRQTTYDKIAPREVPFSRVWARPG
eukprot:TRINITY_DN0_c263_g1_i1.p1 TRINITY_DN0_c263_g1~~TRINITY_DN0_c263_g1_i1.p1  ORF type:complete len:146 (+),score=32.89 TRINITY_DN0_c263_g1_i1:46-483(+)